MLELERTPGERVAGALRRRGMSQRRLVQAVNDRIFLFGLGEGAPKRGIFMGFHLDDFIEGVATPDKETIQDIEAALDVTPGWVTHGGEWTIIKEEGDPLLATMLKGLEDRYESLIDDDQRIELAYVALKILKSSPGGIEALGNEADAIANEFAQELFMLVRGPMSFLKPPAGEGEREYMRGALIELNALAPGGTKLTIEETLDAISRVRLATSWQLESPDVP